MFKIEREEFCSNPKFDEKWQNLAKSLINENIDETEDLLKIFKESIASNIGLTQLAQSDFVKDEAFLMRYIYAKMHGTAWNALVWHLHILESANISEQQNVYI